MIVNEVSRKNLIGKTKVQSPERFDRRLRYSTMSIPEVDDEKLINFDELVIKVKVGNYTDTLSFDGVIAKLIDIVSSIPNHAVTRRAVVRALNERVDETDVYVRCTCMDFQCRFAYQATRHDYLYGPPENRPANVTNPHDDIGAVCKHLACVLSNKKWLVKASSVVNDIIHENYQDILKKYNLSEDEFRINFSNYNRAAIGAAKKELTQLPIELRGAISRIYDPEELESQLFDLLDHRGWWIAVDSDLDTPNYVRLSKDPKALDSDIEGEVYTFEVIPAGTKVRLKQIQSITENY